MIQSPPMDGESTIGLEGLAAGVDHLEAVVVFALSHVSTYASWVRPNTGINASSVATSLREAYLAAAQASGHLAAAGERTSQPGTVFPSLMLEDGARIAIVQRVRSFGVATVFEREIPLGLARAHAHKIARTLEHELPYAPVSAGDPHAPPEAARLPPPSSQPAVTLMMPTYVAPNASPIAHAPTPVAPPVQLARVERPDGEVESDEEPAPETSQTHDLARVEQREVAPPPVSKLPDTVAAEKLGLRRPTPPARDSEAREPPAPALSLTTPFAPALDGSTDASPETRAIRLVAYVEGTSIEPHISLLRLALRSGLGVAQLRDLRRVTAEQLVLLETAAEEMLGLERGKLTEKIRGAVPVLPLPSSPQTPGRGAS